MANTELTRTPSSTTNRKTYTFSAWVKRATISSGYPRIFAYDYADTDRFEFFFYNTDELQIEHVNNNSVDIDIHTTRRFKDTGAWYHIVLAVDTTQSTAADRVKLYINGVQETTLTNAAGSSPTYPPQDSNTIVNYASGSKFFIGETGYSSGGQNFDGCMSHIHFVDGAALAPTVFGSTDSTTGEWKINTSPSYTVGTNGFFILKDGNSVTDQSANTNNFTVAGGTLTNTEDNPSNNFATLLSEYPSDPTGGFANANTTAKSNADSTWRSAFSSIATPPDGKYYMELKWSSGTHLIQGCVSSKTIANNNFKDLTDSYTGNYLALYGANYYSNGSSQGTYGVQLTSGNIGMLAMDRDNNKFWWGVNGSWGTGHNPATNTGGFALPGDLDDFWHFAISVYSNSGAGAYEFNFGNGYFGTTQISSEGTNASGIGKFEYDVPSGFTALSTKGLNE